MSVPNRYRHAPVEIISINDLENTARILSEFVKSVSGKADFTPKQGNSAGSRLARS